VILRWHVLTAVSFSAQKKWISDKSKTCQMWILQLGWQCWLFLFNRSSVWWTETLFSPCSNIPMICVLLLLIWNKAWSINICQFYNDIQTINVVLILERISFSSLLVIAQNKYEWTSEGTVCWKKHYWNHQVPCICSV